MHGIIYQLGTSPISEGGYINPDNISEGDKAFVREFENFVNGQVCSPEKTGIAMTSMHRYLQQQAFKVLLGYMKALAYNFCHGRYDDRNEWASRLAAEAYSHLINKGLVYDPDFAEPQNAPDYV